MKRPRRLSETFISRVTRPGAYGDGGHGSHGLTLRVKARARGGTAKSFVQRLRLHGVPFNVGLGPWPIVTLEEARDTALNNARAVRKGHDPRTKRQAAPAVPTFEEVARAAHALQTAGKAKTTVTNWISSLENHVFPKLGRVPIDAVDSAAILRVLTPIWSTLSTAHQIRQRIGATMNHAIAEGHRSDTPMVAVDAALPRNGHQTTHHAALAHADMPAAMAAIRQADTWAGAKLALQFIILTGGRSGEAREMRWDEVDAETSTWTVPAERMKTRKAHTVPLSDASLRVLALARTLGNDDLVFPSERGGKVISTAVLGRLLRSAGIEGTTTHGMRTAFRTWCADNGEDRELSEMALSHRIGSAVEQAYMRSDLLERRRALMDRWATYLNK